MSSATALAIITGLMFATVGYLNEARVEWRKLDVEAARKLTAIMIADGVLFLLLVLLLDALGAVVALLAGILLAIASAVTAVVLMKSYRRPFREDGADSD